MHIVLLSLFEFSLKSALRKQYFSFGSKINHIYMCTINLYHILQVKNALVKSAYCITYYTFCSLLRTIQSTSDLGISHFLTFPPIVKIPTRRNCAVPSTSEANCNTVRCPWTPFQSSLSQVTLKLKKIYTSIAGLLGMGKSIYDMKFYVSSM